MSVLAIITLAIIVINFFWTQIAHDEYAGDVFPEWIDRVRNVPWLVANVVWMAFAAVDIYLSIHFYLSGEFLFAVAGMIVLAYAFARRTPEKYRHVLGLVSKLTFLPTWAMVFIGMTDSSLIYFSLFVASWMFVASVMQGRFIYLTRLLSAEHAEAMSKEEAAVAAA